MKKFADKVVQAYQKNTYLKRAKSAQTDNSKSRSRKDKENQMNPYGNEPKTLRGGYPQVKMNLSNPRK